MGGGGGSDTCRRQAPLAALGGHGWPGWRWRGPRPHPPGEACSARDSTHKSFQVAARATGGTHASKHAILRPAMRPKSSYFTAKILLYASLRSASSSLKPKKFVRSWRLSPCFGFAFR
jgi:hypothetical protein